MVRKIGASAAGAGGSAIVGRGADHVAVQRLGLRGGQPARRGHGLVELAVDRRLHGVGHVGADAGAGAAAAAWMSSGSRCCQASSSSAVRYRCGSPS